MTFSNISSFFWGIFLQPETGRNSIPIQAISVPNRTGKRKKGAGYLTTTRSEEQNTTTHGISQPPILIGVRNRLLQSIFQQEEDFPYAFNRNLFGGEFKLILLVIIVSEEDIKAIVSLFQPNAG